MVCKLRSIYGLKQASRQWYLNFDHIGTLLGFMENAIDQCVYIKNSGTRFFILVLYFDDILFIGNHIEFLNETKQMLTTLFNMKYLGEASFALGIEIYCDRSRGILDLFQKGYIERILNRFNMKSCKPCMAHI